MTDREIMQQALDMIDKLTWALETHLYIKAPSDAKPLMDALRTALAQPEQVSIEPPDYVEPITFDYHEGWEEGFKAGVGSAKNKKESTPSNVDPLLHGGDGNYIKQAQPEQKPVAWMMPDYGDVLSASEADGTGIYNIPLYTAPPKREQESISTNDHLCAMLRQVHDVLACTALPMKRKWVGLTDIDIHVLKMNHDKVKVVYTDRAEDLTVLGQDVDVNGLINAIQTKLKEMNNAV